MSVHVKSSNWLPLFSGDEALEVYRTLEAIGAALEPHDAEPRDDSDSSMSRAEVAVMYAYLDRALPGRGYLKSAAAALEESITAVAAVELTPALYGGFTGIGWVVEHLREMLPNINDQTSNSVDEGLLAWLRMNPWEEDYDLISGLVGMGVYALERMPQPGGGICLERVIDHLVETAESQADGITWWTRPELLLESVRKEYPQGWYNLGLAHGTPGVIALLGEAYAAGIASERVRRLLEGAVPWLLRRRQSEAAGAAFPSYLRPGLADPPQLSRLAWCYGDLGAAVALFGAARRVGEPQWEDAALAIARGAARRPVEQSGVEDAGLCHGAAGVGHLWNRLFQATGDPLFAEAARFWLRRALAMRKAGQGIAGYLSYGPNPGASADFEWTLGWFPDTSFLTGVTGIALALLGAVSPIAPDWDRRLLTRL